MRIVEELGWLVGCLVVSCFVFLVMVVSTLTLRSMVRTVGEVCFQDEGHGVIDEEISTCIRYSSSSFHSSSLSLFIIVWFACAPPTTGAPSFCIFFLYAVISCEEKMYLVFISKTLGHSSRKFIQLDSSCEFFFAQKEDYSNNILIILI